MIIAKKKKKKLAFSGYDLFYTVFCECLKEI